MTVQAIAINRPRAPFRDAIRASVKLGVREARLSVRNPEVFVPNPVLPIVIFFIFVAALSDFALASGVENYRGFFLPLAVLFAVVGGSAGINMAADIRSGYFDKLQATPVSRVGLLAGALGADFVRIVLQGLLTAAVAMAAGTQIATGVVGAAVMVLIASLFGLAFEALGFAVALRTANPAASRSLFEFVFPLFLLTTSFSPLESMHGWLRTVVQFNPLTYLFRGLRELTLAGWGTGEIMLGLAAAGGLAAAAVAGAFAALRSRAG